MPQSMQHFLWSEYSRTALSRPIPLWHFPSPLHDGRPIYYWRIHHTKGRALNLCAVGNKNLLSTDKQTKAK